MAVFNDAPIYSQLIAQIKVGIVSGAFPPGGAAAFRAGPGYGGRGESQHHAAGPDGAGAGRTGIQPANHG